jgi:hypothetical protein
MVIDQRHRVLRLALVLGAQLLPACAAVELTEGEPGLSVRALELTCMDAPADVTGDVTAILGSIEPLDPSLPQTYGSPLCTGFIFELDNAEGEALHGAWVQAGGASVSDGDVLSESQCAARTLEADYWGYANDEWMELAASSQFGRFDAGELPDTGHCKLEALLDRAERFEKLRIVARVSQAGETYPMFATLW